MKATLKELSKQPFHTFPAVNTLFNGLAHHPDFDSVDWSHLKVSVGGGMAVQSAVAKTPAGENRSPHCAKAMACQKPAPAVCMQPAGRQGIHRHHWLAASQHGRESRWMTATALPTTAKVGEMPSKAPR